MLPPLGSHSPTPSGSAKVAAPGAQRPIQNGVFLHTVSGHERAGAENREPGSESFSSSRRALPEQSTKKLAW